MKKHLLPTIILATCPIIAAAQSSIPTNYDADQIYTNTRSRSLTSVTLSTPSNGKQTVEAEILLAYTDATDTKLLAKPGERVTVNFGYRGEWMNGYVFIDRNGDKHLDVTLNDDHTPATDSELLAYSFYSGNDNDDTTGWNSLGTTLNDGARNILNPPSFLLPDDLTEGEYTIRFKVDWNSLDPGGDTNDTNGNFLTNGGAILDATLLVTQEDAPQPARLHFASDYGFFVGSGVESGLPDLVPSTDLRLKLVAPAKCYATPSEVTVEVKAADGKTINTQNISVPTNGIVTIPATAMTGGDVFISAHWTKPDTYATTDYQLVFSDEFDTTATLDTKKWHRTGHNNNSAWNRYVNNKSDKVVYLSDGELVTRCINCPPEDLAANEQRPWMSGAIDTQGTYSFMYGRVDVRAITAPFAGSFPAIWLLPDNQSAGWPYYGEIDIWEMINSANTAYGTVHAQKQSQKSGNTPCNYAGLYHIYSFEWTPEKMTWSIDGKAAYSTYNKSSLTTSQLNSGYWPFDKTFYLILNQSVGNGSWASNPVDGNTYETRFDFVRVYQTKDQNALVGIDSPTIDTTTTTHHDMLHDLQGRKVSNPHHGIYIGGNGKKVIR